MQNNLKTIIAILLVLAAVCFAYIFYFGKYNMEQSGITPNQSPETDTPQTNDENAVPQANTPETPPPRSESPSPDQNMTPSGNAQPETKPQTEGTGELSLPISDALDRVTKKTFGIKVSPQDSPVSPEKFSGYHTGVDFEIMPGEENTDVSIFSVCSGSIVSKRIATGYGGVLVESCILDGSAVTVIYGHLRLSSVGKKIGGKLSAGEKIGVLGKGYSAETDGERKHLHLGIHKGSAVTLLGYVQKESELASWIDAVKYLK